MTQVDVLKSPVRVDLTFVDILNASGYTNGRDNYDILISVNRAYNCTSGD